MKLYSSEDLTEEMRKAVPVSDKEAAIAALRKGGCVSGHLAALDAAAREYGLGPYCIFVLPSDADKGPVYLLSRLDAENVTRK